MALVFRPMPGLSLAAAVSLVILLVLGSWQWNRYVAKRDAPPVVAASESVNLARAVRGPPLAEYARVRVEGQWDGPTVRVYALSDGRRGARLFTPLATAAGHVWIDRGFVDDQAPVPQDPAGAAEFEGVVRTGVRSNAFTPDNEVSAGRWYWPDIAALSAAGGVRSLWPDRYLAQSMVDPSGTGTPAPNPWADAGGANLIPAERHLGYALTWWGLAGALVGVYLAFHARAGRLRLG